MKKMILMIALVFSCVLDLNTRSATALDCCICNDGNRPFGDYMAEFWEVAAYHNGECMANAKKNSNNEYGYYQCVEYIKRFYDEFFKITISGIGSAVNLNSMYGSFKLVKYPNNTSTTPPIPGDILVYSGGTAGHVGIVKEIVKKTDSTFNLTVIEQNWEDDGIYDGHTLTRNSNGTFSINNRENYTVLSWLRHERFENMAQFQSKNDWNADAYVAFAKGMTDNKAIAQYSPTSYLHLWNNYTYVQDVCESNVGIGGTCSEGERAILYRNSSDGYVHLLEKGFYGLWWTFSDLTGKDIGDPTSSEEEVSSEYGTIAQHFQNGNFFWDGTREKIIARMNNGNEYFFCWDGNSKKFYSNGVNEYTDCDNSSSLSLVSFYGAMEPVITSSTVISSSEETSPTTTGGNCSGTYPDTSNWLTGGNVIDLAISDSGDLYAVSEKTGCGTHTPEIYISHDGGLNWSKINSPVQVNSGLKSMGEPYMASKAVTLDPIYPHSYFVHAYSVDDHGYGRSLFYFDGTSYTSWKDPAAAGYGGWQTDLFFDSTGAIRYVSTIESRSGARSLCTISSDKLSKVSFSSGQYQAGPFAFCKNHPEFSLAANWNNGNTVRKGTNLSSWQNIFTFSSQQSGGVTWTEKIFVNPLDCYRIILPVNDDRGPNEYGRTKLYLSNNHGTSFSGPYWIPQESWDNYFTDLVFHPKNRDIVYASSYYGVYRSTDSGMNWTKIHSNSTGAICVSSDGRVLYIGEATSGGTNSGLRVTVYEEPTLVN